MFPKGGGCRDEIEGCDVTGSLSQVPAMLEIINRAMAPAHQGEIEGWLAELSVLVPRRPDDEFTEAMRLGAYTARLATFPADVARKALLGRTWKFWPSWDELSAECKRLSAARVAMKEALENPNKPAPSQRGPRCAGDVAASIASAAGFDQSRTRATQAAPMVSNREELANVTAQDKVSHWSETAAPDDPRWESVRKARAENPLIQESIRGAKRAV